LKSAAASARNDAAAASRRNARMGAIQNRNIFFFIPEM
jgi:hypothetical protein